LHRSYDVGTFRTGNYFLLGINEEVELEEKEEEARIRFTTTKYII
jgi:hypothetical protein